VEFRENHLERALQRCRSAFDVLSGDEPDQERAIVAAQLGRFLALTGLDREALEVLEEALELASHLELPEVYSNALASRSIGLRRSGRVDEGRVLLQRAVEVAVEHDLGAAASRAYNNLAVALESLDRYRDEAALANEALELERRKGDKSLLASWLIGMLVPLGMLGRWDEAIESANEARAMEELTPNTWASAGLLDLVMLHVPRG